MNAILYIKAYQKYGLWLVKWYVFRYRASSRHLKTPSAYLMTNMLMLLNGLTNCLQHLAKRWTNFVSSHPGNIVCRYIAITPVGHLLKSLPRWNLIVNTLYERGIMVTNFSILQLFSPLPYLWNNCKNVNWKKVPIVFSDENIDYQKE